MNFLSGCSNTESPEKNYNGYSRLFRLNARRTEETGAVVWGEFY